MPLSADDGARIMGKYARQHPDLAKRLCAVMGYAVDGSSADFAAVGRRTPFVELVPRPE